MAILFSQSNSGQVIQSFKFKWNKYYYTCPLSGTTQVNQHQNSKPKLDLLQQETKSNSGISWVKSTPCPRQITMPAPHDSSFTGQMPFLAPNQQHEITEGKKMQQVTLNKRVYCFFSQISASVIVK